MFGFFPQSDCHFLCILSEWWGRNDSSRPSGCFNPEEEVSSWCWGLGLPGLGAGHSWWVSCHPWKNAYYSRQSWMLVPCSFQSAKTTAQVMAIVIRALNSAFAKHSGWRIFSAQLLEEKAIVVLTPSTTLSISHFFHSTTVQCPFRVECVVCHNHQLCGSCVYWTTSVGHCGVIPKVNISLSSFCMCPSI